MQYASSLLYGGSLMDAANGSTYEDYKRLLLVCPHCKNPVFLVNPQECRKAHQRIRNGKTVNVKQSKQIDSYWAHFPGVDSDECERKAKTFSRKDRDRIEANARNQRLKLFQRHFWGIVTKKSSLISIATKAEPLYVKFGQIGEYSKTEALAVVNELACNLSSDFQWFVKNSNNVNLLIDSSCDVLTERGFMSKIETHLHTTTVYEIALFLTTNKSFEMVKELMLLALAGIFNSIGYRVFTNAKTNAFDNEFIDGILVFCKYKLNPVPVEKLDQSVHRLSTILIPKIFEVLCEVNWGDALHELASSEKAA